MTRGFLGASAATLAIVSILAAGPAFAAGATIFIDDFDGGLCAWSVVEPLPVEICDLLDNDCDGTPDDACVFCAPSDPTPLCGPGSHCSPQESGQSLCSSPAGSGTQGASCLGLADCSGPYACVGSPQSFCRLWCPFPSGSCPGGTTCTDLTPPVFTGPTPWGICL